MDTLLENGGFVPTPTGLPQTVVGREELLQRARIRLTVPKGVFPYQPELGSGLPTLGGFSPAAALDMAVQALRPLPGVTAQAVRQTESGLTVTVELMGERCEITLPTRTTERNLHQNANLR